MKKAIYLGLAVVLMACSQEESPALETTNEHVETKPVRETTEAPTRVSREADTLLTTPEESIKKRKYNGRWFSVDFPDNFSASPLSPEEKINDYAYVETDEARFTSPDGTVEFFIYSPQWSGIPKDYLTKQPNEKLVESSIEKGDPTDSYSPTHKWVTYEDKDGAYTRAFHSIKTELTHHVFGVKYTDKKSYERYKAKYMEFKKSLRQYAD